MGSEAACFTASGLWAQADYPSHSFVLLPSPCSKNCDLTSKSSSQGTSGTAADALRLLRAAVALWQCRLILLSSFGTRFDSWAASLCVVLCCPVQWTICGWPDSSRYSESAMVAFISGETAFPIWNAQEIGRLFQSNKYCCICLIHLFRTGVSIFLMVSS